LGVLYLAQDGSFGSFGWNGSNWNYESALLTTGGQAIYGTQGVAAKAWPDTQLPNWAATEYMTLAAMPNAAGGIRLYKLNYATNKWDLLNWTCDTGAVTIGKPLLEYRTVRNSSGAGTADYAGHFYVGFGLNDLVDGVRSVVRVSRKFTRNSPVSVGTSASVLCGDTEDYVQDMWARLVPGSAAVMYSDATLDNVFGLMSHRYIDKNNVATDYLHFFPHADTSPLVTLTVHSDFMVMEDNICGELGHEDCGVIDVLQ
jgi:hypothetical protein